VGQIRTGPAAAVCVWAAEPFGLNPVSGSPGTLTGSGGDIMNGIIYLVGLVVVILAILSFFGLR
jgi:hypothetical protein